VGIWRQRNHNALLGVVEGVDGLKTGYIDEAGYHIALTAARQETRLVAVILGAPVRGGDRIRDEDGRRLLEWGFSHFKTLWPPQPAIPPVRIWKGAVNWAEAVPAEPLPFTVLSTRGQDLRWEAVLEDPLIAPLARGDELGALLLYDREGELRRVPLIAGEDIAAGNSFKRAWDSVVLFFRRIFGAVGRGR
jgi:D-alanyl-D-alanine carboxypeptidase (penicillin-binding protein 5/6)